MATLSAQRKHKVTIVGSGNWCVHTAAGRDILGADKVKLA